MTPQENESIDMKLQRAKERREEMDRIREITLQDKNQQALQRAKENMECKRERMRKKTSRVAKVKARRNMLEEKNRKQVLASIQNKLNGAVIRAEENIKKKQIKARNKKRTERAEKRRKLLEFERRSNLLSTVDRRSELAQKNVELMLKDRQVKARESIEHAQYVSKRVRAARVLQRAVRALTWGAEKEPEVKDAEAAAIRLQCWAPWKVNVACRRLFDGSPAPLESLKLLLSKMGQSHSENSRRCLSFDDLTVEMTQNDTLLAANRVISSFGPIVGVKVSTSSARTLLSTFLIAHQPAMVFGPKRGADRCSRLLEAASHKLVKALVELATLNDQYLHEDQNYCATSVTRAASCLLSYCTLFEKWKRADVDDLVKDMAKSATQSWIACLTAKRAIAYAEEKSESVDKSHGDPLFQHKIRYKSTRRGANSHLKRIRASLDKLLGPDEGFAIMKNAKLMAQARIKEDGSSQRSVNEIDAAIQAHSEKIESETKKSADHIDINDAAALDDVNEHVVHEILLADDEDIRERLCKTPDESIVDSVETFMDKFRENISQSDAAVTLDSFAFTMEKAFSDQMKDNWIATGSMTGVKEMLCEVLLKMRNLVPKRKDLHIYFNDIHASNCKDVADVLALLMRVAEAMSSSLESEYRSVSTLAWLKATRSFGTTTKKIPFQFPDIESYTVISMLFLLKKLDLCHADLVTFKLMRATPLIRQNGVSYERQKFHQKYPTTDELQGTKTWVKRMEAELSESSPNYLSVLKHGFVDELLFVSERISMPEVLCLDAARIGSIRERAQRMVICSSLLLHACNAVRYRVSSRDLQNLDPNVRYRKEDILKSLRNNLPYDELFQATSVAIVSFAEGMFLVILNMMEKIFILVQTLSF